MTRKMVGTYMLDIQLKSPYGRMPFKSTTPSFGMDGTGREKREKMKKSIML
jgi:hypothetical protein